MGTTIQTPHHHSVYMRRCLALAQIARGNTSPNPMVGSVIVYKGNIIGEGYHPYAGAPHAEVMAWRSVDKKDQKLIHNASWYVSLEPCAHYGKTPPCAALLAALHPQEVIIAMQDPFAQVQGRGIAMLRAEGIKVTVGVLEEEARTLNRHFIVAHTEHRPYVTLKWSESNDGYLDRQRYTSQQPPWTFSDALRLRHVHYLRATHDAILVGHRTARLDNPHLTNRLIPGRSPLRIVWCHSSLPSSALSLLELPEAPTLLALPRPLLDEAKRHSYPDHVALLPLEENSVEELLEALAQRGIQSLLVEGGADTLQRFIDANCVDEVDIERSPIQLGQQGGPQTPHLPLAFLS